MVNYIQTWLENNVTGWILIVLGTFYLVAELCSNGSTIKDVIVSIWAWFRENILFRMRLLRRRHFNKQLSSKEFLKWQFCVLKKLYFSEQSNCDFELTKLQVGDKEHEYEAAIWKVGNTIEYPFSGIL